MRLRLLAFIATALLAASGAASAAGNCEAIRDGIEKKIRAAGVARFTLSVVDAGATAPGRNVGSCDRGSRKILYVAGEGAATLPAASAASAARPPQRRAPEAIVTECRDGSVVTSGDCPKK